MSKASKTKELKTFSMQVVTPEHIKRDERKMKLLHVIQHLGAISEKALTYLLYYLKEKGMDLGYHFIVIGGKPMSREVIDDLMALLYTGLVENDPRTKKLRLTSNGMDFMEKNALPKEAVEDLLKAVDELKPKIAPIDAEIELSTTVTGPRLRKR